MQLKFKNWDVLLQKELLKSSMDSKAKISTIMTTIQGPNSFGLSPRRVHSSSCDESVQK